MPGLVDAYSHCSIDPGKGDQTGQMRAPRDRRALWAPDYLRRDLLAGTTTMRIMAEEEFLDLKVRAAIVGLPDGAVREARERGAAAIKNSGFVIPQPFRVTVNLARRTAPRRLLIG